MKKFEAMPKQWRETATQVCAFLGKQIPRKEKTIKKWHTWLHWRMWDVDKKRIKAAFPKIYS